MIFVLAVALLAASLIALFIGEDGAPILGLPPDQFAQAAMLSAIAVALLASLATRFHSRWGEAARSLAIWALILIAFAGLYSYRHEVGGFADRVTGEILPGRVSSAGPGEASVVRRRDGHFALDMSANGVPMRFVFDTGASAVVVRAEDAERIHIDSDKLLFNTPVSTANGMAMAAQTRIATLAVGAIVVHNVRALVTRPGALQENLLGQSFLDRLSSYSVERDRLILRGPPG
jgi:aspartyl protease family protein